MLGEPSVRRVLHLPPRCHRQRLPVLRRPGLHHHRRSLTAAKQTPPPRAKLSQAAAHREGSSHDRTAPSPGRPDSGSPTQRPPSARSVHVGGLSFMVTDSWSSRRAPGAARPHPVTARGAAQRPRCPARAHGRRSPDGPRLGHDLTRWPHQRQATRFLGPSRPAAMTSAGPPARRAIIDRGTSSCPSHGQGPCVYLPFNCPMPHCAQRAMPHRGGTPGSKRGAESTLIWAQLRPS